MGHLTLIHIANAGGLELRQRGTQFRLDQHLAFAERSAITAEYGSGSRITEQRPRYERQVARQSTGDRDTVTGKLHWRCEQSLERDDTITGMEEKKAPRQHRHGSRPFGFANCPLRRERREEDCLRVAAVG